ncbi:hypothetical protein acdb102_27520 [Acidothermaceae bacterium B102]|nr:hypothetical protein acdb102_27520 [Acidothermaceae bacterium B102]
MVLIGGQAVQLRTSGLPGLAVTADADVGIHPHTLIAAPIIGQALRDAGFSAVAGKPGTWVKAQVIAGTPFPISLDLMVPATMVKGRRTAQLVGHESQTARRVTGLESVLVDNEPITVTSLEPEDHRRFLLRVAGVASLLIAKAYKIQDRIDEPAPGRQADKDAGDVLRLMATSDPDDVAARLRDLVSDELVGESVSLGLRKLRPLFVAARSVGTNMAVDSLRGSLDEATVRALAPAYVARLPRG